MNRLPPALPGRWLDELLPGQSHARTGQRPAWRFATAAAPQTATPAQAAPRPARVHGKPAAQAQAEAPRTVRAAPSPVREQPVEDGEACRAGRGGSGDGQGSSGGGSGAGDGRGDAGPAGPGAVAESAGAFDAQDIVLLLPAGNASGIFEVQLPGGEMMAVAVDAGPSAVSYHLKPAGKSLAERLRGQQKELSAHLERRIGKDVTLTIL
ncbi:hypothetical protein SAMN05518865_106271 [Duganella sp. CF458]|uniref:hypothetical protein n=1 Tax=Duganella sp. CF458 TaxID=1884368 RepID=UPI0008DFA25E|nr:hypothetical protein [Duganella sp. CF458]SFF95559.1 hypothetical protein SAMN05518865_106271 [Duganella sp. CF458]